MVVAFDAIMLSLYFHPGSKAPRGELRVAERIALLIEELQAANAKVVIPTPILSEFLVLAGADGPTYLSELGNSDVFDIQPFDTIAAVEAATYHMSAIAAGGNKRGADNAGTRWQVVKVDRQLVAIAKTRGVDVLYSDDDGVRKTATAVGIVCKGIADLPTPPENVVQTPDLFDSVSAGDGDMTSELESQPRQGGFKSIRSPSSGAS